MKQTTYIGEGTSISGGATILPGIRIGKKVIIGAGSVATKNIEDVRLFMVIARKIKEPLMIFESLNTFNFY